MPSTMGRPESHPPSLKTYFTLNAAALLTAGTLMLLLARGGGYSSLRSILIGATFLLGAGVLAAAIRLQLQPEKEQTLYHAVFSSDRTRRIKWILSILFLAFWCLTWLPPQHTAGAHAYFVGLYPLILCGLLASGTGLVFSMADGKSPLESSWRKWLRENRPACYVALAALAAFALIALLTARLKILPGNEPLWYGAGVPLLTSQVFITVILAAVALNFNAIKARGKIPSDLIVFLLIWVVTAAFWAARPVPESYWVTGPRAPNWEFYPFSDLVTFDLGSQFALIGQGINNHVFFDRALYMSFLVFLHSVGGQGYQKLMAIQAAVFAILPALLYLAGKKLHSTAAGLILAALTAMRGINSLGAAAWVDTATFKHMLTDFPTAIGVAAFVVLVLGWLEDPRARWRHALWAAGVLGLTSLLRPHVLLLAPTLPVLAIWLHRSQWKTGMWLSGLTLIAFLAGVAPWIFLGPGSRSIIAFYGTRIRDVIATRYTGAFRRLARPPAQPPVTQVPLLPGGQPEATPAPSPPPPRLTTAAKPAVPFVVSQFLHNLVTSGLIFPDSPQFLSIRETVKLREEFWRPKWDGSMSPLGAGMLLLNLGVVAAGLGAVYKRLRWRGMFPVVVLLIYYVANSFARSSGGRYLVPTDWIVVGYYAVGLVALIQIPSSVINRDTAAPVAATFVAEKAQAPSLLPALAILAQLALIGALVPLAGVLYPPRYPPKDAQTLLAEIEPFASRLGQTASAVSAFMQQPNAAVLYGRALYPRFYPQGVGEPTRYLPFGERDFPRMVFVLIGPHGSMYALLPGRAAAIPNASDVIVLGCRSAPPGWDVVSSLLVVLPDQAIGYARSPAAPLLCPLPEPVCDNNKNCH